MAVGGRVDVVFVAPGPSVEEDILSKGPYAGPETLQEKARMNCSKGLM
jgi:hypothetical protein